MQRENLSRSTILSFDWVCNHFLQLLYKQRCNWSRILWLTFLHNCLSFVSILDDMCVTCFSSATILDVILERFNLLVPFFNYLYEHVNLLFKLCYYVFTCIHVSHHNWHYIWMRHLLIWAFRGRVLFVNHNIIFFITISPFDGLDICSQMFFATSKDDISLDGWVFLERLRVFGCLPMSLVALKVLPWDVMISLDFLQNRKRWKVEMVPPGMPNCSHEI